MTIPNGKFVKASRGSTRRINGKPKLLPIIGSRTNARGQGVIIVLCYTIGLIGSTTDGRIRSPPISIRRGQVCVDHLTCAGRSQIRSGKSRPSTAIFSNAESYIGTGVNILVTGTGGIIGQPEANPKIISRGPIRYILALICRRVSIVAYLTGCAPSISADIRIVIVHKPDLFYANSRPYLCCLEVDGMHQTATGTDYNRQTRTQSLKELDRIFRSTFTAENLGHQSSLISGNSILS